LVNIGSHVVVLLDWIAMRVIKKCADDDRRCVASKTGLR